MAIKKLQNNFTTPEQSKRLLKLGVPADSADCYICEVGNLYNATIPQIRRDGDASICLDTHLPCWSAGRLREIFCICSSVSGNREYPFYNDQVAWWITEFEFKKEFIDFSKLEE